MCHSTSCLLNNFVAKSNVRQLWFHQDTHATDNGDSGAGDADADGHVSAGFSGLSAKAEMKLHRSVATNKFQLHFNSISLRYATV